MSETKVSSTLEMYITTINGIQAIKACKRNIALFIKKGDPIPVTAMPFGELTFIKQ